MPVELKNENKPIAPSQMKDGDIGEIVKNESQPESVGRIVQKNKDRLVAIGLPFGSSFWASENKADYGTMRVRILPPGTLLEIT